MANSAPGGSFGREGSSQFITVAMAATYGELGCGLTVSQSDDEAREQSRMIQKVSRIERGERGGPGKFRPVDHRGPKPNPLSQLSASGAEAFSHMRHRPCPAHASSALQGPLARRITGGSWWGHTNIDVRGSERGTTIADFPHTFIDERIKEYLRFY